MRRVLDFDEGVAMVVTDLHGNWDAYARYRDRFERLLASGRVDRWILCGDLVHSDGPAEADRSLDMVLDVMQCQAAHDPGVVTMLLGNHELPHLYSMPLSRGHIDYTPRFEQALTERGDGTRARVMAFFDALPFYIRTAAGVMIAHVGASPLASTAAGRARLEDHDHRAAVTRIDDQVQAAGPDRLRRRYEILVGQEYDEEVCYLLGVTGPDDPRYDDLLRNMAFTRGDADFDLLWDTFFSSNERSAGHDVYTQQLRQFLAVWSVGAPAEQSLLVSGHIATFGGHALVAGQQLRLASWAHANPQDSGEYLLLDCAGPPPTIEKLLGGLESVFSA